MAFSNNSYPALFQKSNEASLLCQSAHMRIQKWYLILVGIGGLTGVISALGDPWIKISAWMYVVFALVALALLLASRIKRFDKGWFDCRAVAESSKTVAWRYMMRCPPFVNDSTADDRMILELKEIRKSRQCLEAWTATTSTPNTDEISQEMRRIRALPTAERANVYREARIQDQHHWYSSKAANNAKAGHWFFALILLSQVAAILAACYFAASDKPLFNPVSIFAISASSLMAWSALKRHDDLAQSYAMACQELGEVASQKWDSVTEEEFVQLIEQGEECISREHTMWCAKRETAPVRKTTVIAL